MKRAKRILLTGATGFIGQHLHPRLVAHGFSVVGGTREPERARRRLAGREFCFLNLEDEASLGAALSQCDAALYLVHSMADRADYAGTEAENARRFARVAAEQRVERIVYLGGARPHGRPSRHLQSRLDTGAILRAGAVPTLELQASMIIGPGSASFRMVRDLAARLPVMLLPSWLETRSQPIALEDVLYALEAGLTVPLTRSVAHALPGPEVLSARQILQRTSHLLGMDAKMWGLPFVTPRLSSYWITLITRADSHVARELVEGLRSDLVSNDEGFWRALPPRRLVSFDEAVQKALSSEERGLDLRGRLTERLVRTLSKAHAPKAAHAEARR